jgi:hypothetical protein
VTALDGDVASMEAAFFAELTRSYAAGVGISSTRQQCDFDGDGILEPNMSGQGGNRSVNQTSAGRLKFCQRWRPTPPTIPAKCTVGGGVQLWVGRNSPHTMTLTHNPGATSSPLSQASFFSSSGGGVASHGSVSGATGTITDSVQDFTFAASSLVWTDVYFQLDGALNYASGGPTSGTRVFFVFAPDPVLTTVATITCTP